jgi:prepilin-type N-terminal cleavage/methylation domain-containing protein
MIIARFKKLRRGTWGFTMVEMLAVIAVMAIIVALVVPNGIHARTVGEEATVRAQAASLEMGLSTYLMQYGAQAKTEYQAAEQSGADLFAKLQAILALLHRHGAMPQSMTATTLRNTFEGYDLRFPTQLGGGLRVTRVIDGNTTQIYP